jgi:hypothetical protein
VRMLLLRFLLVALLLVVPWWQRGVACLSALFSLSLSALSHTLFLLTLDAAVCSNQSVALSLFQQQQ